MRSLIAFSALALLTVQAYSQINIKVEPMAALPLGGMKDYYAAGVGAEVSVKYVIGGRLGFGLSSGFQHFFSKDWESEYSDVNFNIIPIRGSITYYLSTGATRTYLGVEAGANRTELTYSYRYYDVYGGYHINIDRDYSSTRFGGAAVFGCEIGLGSSIALDFSTKYNTISEVDADSPRQTAKYVSGGIGVVIRFE